MLWALDSNCTLIVNTNRVPTPADTVHEMDWNDVLTVLRLAATTGQL